MLNREVRSPAADIVYVLTDDSVQFSYDDVVMRTLRINVRLRLMPNCIQLCMRLKTVCIISIC